jgi:Leucine-rich repeat (LRR) protein
MMGGSLFLRGAVAGWIGACVLLAGCSAQRDDGGGGGRRKRAVGGESGAGPQAAPRAATAKPEDTDAAKKLVDALGAGAKCTLLPGNVMTEIVIQDGSALCAENIALFGKLADLQKLQVFDFRSLNDEMVSQLAGLKNLTALALTNSAIGDGAVEMIVKSFPNLTELDLSSNTNMTNGVLKAICELGKLERLILVQNRINDVGTSRLSKLKNLEVLDLRGNMEAGDMTMEVVGTLPRLAVLKHRSTTVTDVGMEHLARSKTLQSLLMQDFGVTSQAGQHIAALGALTELEIFRCQGFGSDGVLALKGMMLARITLRDLPMVDDQAMAVLGDLPQLKRLYLHEIDSISDEGLKNLGSLKSLELLDIWSVSQMTDATVDVIAPLPNLRELSIRATGVTDAAVDRLLAMANLESLTFKENAAVTAEGLKKLSAKKWSKLDVGAAE